MRIGQAFGVGGSLLLMGAIWMLSQHVYATYRSIQEEPTLIVSPVVMATEGAPLPPELTVSLVGLEDVKAIIERPIFSPSRRPADVAADVSAAAPVPAFDMDLLGIMIWQGQRVALVRAKGNDEVIKITEGGTVGGWVAVGIESEQVLFRYGDVETTIHLAYNGHEDGG